LERQERKGVDPASLASHRWRGKRGGIPRELGQSKDAEKSNLEGVAAVTAAPNTHAHAHAHAYSLAHETCTPARTSTRTHSNTHSAPSPRHRRMMMLPVAVRAATGKPATAGPDLVVTITVETADQRINRGRVRLLSVGFPRYSAAGLIL
jgi:ferric-dicitrate binding protein FerR (iron transport regulator)